MMICLKCRGAGDVGSNGQISFCPECDGCGSLTDEYELNNTNDTAPVHGSTIVPSFKAGARKPCMRR